jgi:Peptidase family M48
MAHDKLRHVQENVMREVDTKWTNKTKQKIKKLLSDDVTIEDLTSLRQWIYRASEFDRKKEYEADSLGFLLYKNAGYHQKSSITALNMLDSAKYPKYYSHDDFFSPLDSDKFPFKGEWLKERLSIYNRKPESTFLFSTDSIQSHPPTEQRILILNTLIEDSTQNNSHAPAVPLDYVVTTSEFQTVEAAYLANRYDHALYNILQLWTMYPHNDYLTSRATKILIDIHEAKKELATNRYASLARYTGYYGDCQRQVNNLLYNISISEIGEVAFSLINNKSNFNSLMPAHYYLLWRVCSLTFRDKVKAQVETAYKERFGKKIADYHYK